MSLKRPMSLKNRGFREHSELLHRFGIAWDQRILRPGFRRVFTT